MRKYANYFVPAALVFGLVQPLFSQAPRKGASEQVLVQGVSSISNYWTPQRRANAIPRDSMVDPLSVTPGSAAPTSNEPETSTPGALPRRGNAATAATTPAELADDYWTEERRAGAAPRELGVEAHSDDSSAAVDPLGYSYAYPFSQFPVSQLLYRTNLVYPYTTVGKLFFTLGIQDYMCSASVIRPHLLLTARHCIFEYVHPSGGFFATNVVFYPGYNGASNANLGGAWFARWLYTWVANAENWRYDIGFVQLYDDTETGCGGSAGTPVEAYTGYLGFRYGGSYNKRHWNEFGYPAEPPFGGNVMIESQSSTGAQDQFGVTDTVEVGNSQTGGTSGGPWILNFKQGKAGANNYANGVNSFRFTIPDRARAINSPKFFEYNFYNLLVGAQALACP
jgi:V8-like Glu-specific endopeptidase